MNRKDAIKNLNKKCEDLLESKSQDYSNDNLIKTGKPGISSRIVDKAQRLYNLSTKDPKSINHETLEDTLLDLINYTHLYNIENKKLLKPKYNLVFLSGPIDDVCTTTAGSWRTNLARLLASNGVSCYNPNEAFHLSIKANLDFVSENVIEINKEAIRQCDLMIANLSGEGRAFGTIREIEYAKLNGKEVIVVGDIRSLARYDCVVLPNMVALYDYLSLTPFLDLLDPED